jgi:PAS domain S-box-containing protein
MTLHSFQDRYGLNNRQVADLIGCSLPTIQKWRAGNIAVSPSAERLLKLLDHLAKGDARQLAEVLARTQMTPSDASDSASQSGTADSMADQRFRPMVDSQREAVCRWKPDTTISYANKAFCSLFKRPPRKIIGARWLDLLMEEDRENMSKQLPSILKKKGRSRHSHQVIDADGSVHTIEWTYCPIKDSDGMVREWQAVGHDITEEIRAKREMLDRLRMETLVAGISKRFIHIVPDALDNEIDHCLGQFGTQTGVDRVYLFQLTEDSRFLSNTHEWCSEGIEPQKQNLQNLPTSEFPWWMREISAGRTINYFDLDQLPQEASYEESALRAQGIQSILVLPIISQSRLLGFLGFDSVSHRRVWRSSEIALLAVASDVFAKALEGVHQQRKAARNMKYQEVAAGIAHLCTWSWHLEHQRLCCCPRIAHILGFSPDECEKIGLPNWMDYVHPDDLESMKAKVMGYLAGESTALDIEVRLLNRARSYVWCAVRGEVVEHTPEGRPLVIVGAVWEISRRKEAEIRLRRSHDFYQSVLQNVPTLVWSTDLEGRREYFNEAFLGFTGKSLTQLASGEWKDSIHPDDRAEYLLLLEESFQQRSPFTRIFRMQNRNGAYCWMREMSRPIEDSNRIFRGFVGAMIDVTEQYKAWNIPAGLMSNRLDDGYGWDPHGPSTPTAGEMRASGQDES